MPLGAIIKQVRVKKGLTQVQLAKKTRLTQTYISSIEAGDKNPRPATLNRICRVFGLPPQILVYMTLTEKDIKKEKLPLFKKLKPVIDSIIDEVLK